MLPPLKAPLDLFPKTAEVSLTCRPSADWKGGSVTIEMSGKLPEITHDEQPRAVLTKPATKLWGCEHRCSQPHGFFVPMGGVRVFMAETEPLQAEWVLLD